MHAQRSLFDLRDEVAVVVGATGVLGGALAEGLAVAGARVAVVGRNEERGQERVRLIRKQGSQAEFFAADALNPADLRQVHQAIREVFGDPTVLCNAAGGNTPQVTLSAQQSFADIQTADWRQSFDLNLVGGALLPCQEFGPGMVERRRGSIINIASVAAHVPLSRVIAYAAAKSAVLSLTQFLAREWAPHGVRVNSISPGFFPAEQNRALLYQPDGQPTARTQSILQHTPMGRFGRAEELAGAITFLASRQASGFVTGIDLRVDGGFLSQTI